MAQYDDDDLLRYAKEEFKRDAEFREAIKEAIKRKRRGFIGNLISDLARVLFGSVVQRIVDSVIDRFINWLDD